MAEKSVKDDSSRTPEKRLVEHVVVLYVRGKVGLDENDLVDVFEHMSRVFKDYSKESLQCLRLFIPILTRNDPQMTRIF